MNKVIGTLTAVIALAFAGTSALAETAPTAPSNNAAPITAELAKTCRELAIKAHPTEVAGSKAASGQAQRDYFKECVAKSGNMQDK